MNFRPVFSSYTFSTFLFLGASLISACGTPPPPPPQEDAGPPKFEEDFIIESVPDGATVTLSSGESCITPCTITKMNVDTFDAVVEKKGYKKSTTAIVSHVRVIPGSGESGAPELPAPRLNPNPLRVTLRRR